MQFNRNSILAGLSVFAALVPVLAPGVAPAGAYPNTDIPNVRREQYPLDDAVVLRLDESWALQPDGSVRYEYHRMIKLFSDRLFRREGDAQVAFREGLDSIEFITARTILPDGTALAVPEYSFNLVSPGNVARWPAFADEREWVVSFSGVQNGAVLDLHYVRTSKPGSLRWLAGDLRLHSRYPVMERNVSVTLPAGRSLHFRADRVPAEMGKPQIDKTGSETTWRWRFRDLKYQPDESAAIPWQERCGRLRFTDCPDSTAWLRGLVSPMESAAQADQDIRKFAADIAEQQVDTRSKVREIAAAMRKTFNFVNAQRAWMGHDCRPAPEVFDGNYGTQAEAVALLVAMLRSVGVEARPMVAVSQRLFDETAPVDSSVQAFVLQVHTEDGPAYLHPATGFVDPTGDWADRVVLGMNGTQPSDPIRLAELAGAPESGVRVRGNIKIDEGGKATGSLKLRLSGRFADFESLRQPDAARKAIDNVLSHLLEGFEVTDVSSTELLPGRFLADAEVASKETLPKLEGEFLLTTAAETPALNRIHLPLARSERQSPVHLGPPFTEDLRLTVEYPGSWNASVLPIGLPVVSGQWGDVEQQVVNEPGKLVIERRISFKVRRLEPRDFPTARDALNALRSDAARRFLAGPGSED
jgi:hypothetical protein